MEAMFYNGVRVGGNINNFANLHKMDCSTELMVLVWLATMFYLFNIIANISDGGSWC